MNEVRKNLQNDVEEKLAQAKALIFDCDGTLVDSAPVYSVAWAKGLALSGKKMPEDWYRVRNGLSEHVLMDVFEQQHDLTLDREAVVQLMRQTYLDEIHRVEEIATVATIARRQHGRLPLAVASGGSTSIVRASLEALGLDDLFDTIVTVDDVGKPKPDPAAFLEAARRLKVPTESCLVFEDSEQGIAAAKAAGMPFIDVLRLIGAKE